ncbi:hypothetical protein BU17DRAFT_20630, partial [Hysterangium stoloniferum]
FWCSQDEAHKKMSKASNNPDIKNHDNSGSSHILINLQHHIKHVQYVDVAMPPEVLQMIQDHVEWLTPIAMMTKVQLVYPTITSTQVHTAWRELSKVHWFREDLQLPSVMRLLAEYGNDIDIFGTVDVPEGVEILAWRMKHIAEPLQGKVIEI